MAAQQQVQVDQTSAGLNDLAYQELQLGHYELAYRISSQALSQSKIEKNLKEQARAVSNLASNLYYLGDIESSLRLYSESLQISRAENDLLGINRALNNLATIYSGLNDYEEALKYRKLQLENSVTSKEINDQVKAYIGLSQIYSYQQRYREANQSVLRARELLKVAPNDFIEVYLLMTEALIEDPRYQPKKPSILLHQANKIAVHNNFEGLIISTNANLVEYYLKEKNYAKVISEGNKSLKSAKKAKHQSKMLQLHNHLADAYQATNQFQKALQHFKQVNLINKQIAGEKVRLISEVTKIDRQMSEKEEQLLQMAKDQEILSLMLEAQKQRQIIWGVIISLLFISVFFLYSRRNSNREIIRQKKLNKRLEELDIVKDRVLTNTSHELRTPLNGIVGLSDIIIHDEKSNVSEATLNCLKLIKSSGEQLTLVVNDILELSKLRHSQLKIVKSGFDVQELIEDVITVCKPNIPNSAIDIINLDHGKSIFVEQDRGRLQQVLFNIIGNAIKFTNSGFIQVSSQVESDTLVIIVSDSGVGIPDDKLDRVFEGFEQVDSSDARQQSGTGLGLAITKGIIEALSGSIVLESKLREGTKVVIRLPC